MARKICLSASLSLTRANTGKPQGGGKGEGNSFNLLTAAFYIGNYICRSPPPLTYGDSENGLSVSVVLAVKSLPPGTPLVGGFSGVPEAIVGRELCLQGGFQGRCC